MMIMVPRQVDVGEYIVPIEKVNTVLQVLDAIRSEHGLAIAIHRVHDGQHDAICILVELTKIHLPVQEFHRIISAPICEACAQI